MGRTLPTCYDIFSLEMQTVDDPAAETGHSLFLTIIPTINLKFTVTVKFQTMLYCHITVSHLTGS